MDARECAYELGEGGDFRVEKHGGFGLEHTFCNDDTAGRNYHVLMQIAYALWQVFDTGVLSRLSEGCRKPTQEMWAKMLFVAILVLGLASVPRIPAGAFRRRIWHSTSFRDCATTTGMNG